MINYRFLVALILILAIVEVLLVQVLGGSSGGNGGSVQNTLFYQVAVKRCMRSIYTARRCSRDHHNPDLSNEKIILGQCQRAR